MRRSVLAIAAYCFLCGAVAHSDSIPIFQNGLAALTVSSSGTFEFNAAIRFNLGNFAFQGMTATCDFCLSGFNGGTLVPLTLTITDAIGSAMFNDVQYSNLLFHGSLQLGTQPPAIRIPLGNGNLSRFVIFGYSGQMNACPADPSGTACASADIATFQIQAAGSDGFVSFSSDGGGLYSFSSATFNNCCSAPVPEPASFIMLGTGISLLTSGAFIHIRKSKLRNSQ